MVTPVGNDVDETWQNILAGKSGIAPIDHFDTSEFSTRIGGSIRNLALDDYIAKKDQKKMDPFIHYGLVAGIQAIQNSGLEVTENNASRIGVAIGSGIGGLPGIEKGTKLFAKGGPRKISPFFVEQDKIQDLICSLLSVCK